MKRRSNSRRKKIQRRAQPRKRKSIPIRKPQPRKRKSIPIRKPQPRKRKSIPIRKPQPRKLLQTKAAKHRRLLYAKRVKVKTILRKRLRGEKITYQEHRLVQSRKKKTPRILRQKASSKTVRLYLQVSFLEKTKKARLKKPRITKSKSGETYRSDIDRGNFKVRLYSSYVTMKKSDLTDANLSKRIRRAVEKYEAIFNKAKQFERMNASAQLFTGRILNPYTGLIGRPSSITAHARMRTVKRRKDTEELDETDFSFELSELENKFAYMEEVGFLNYGESEDDDE